MRHHRRVWRVPRRARGVAAVLIAFAVIRAECSISPHASPPSPVALPLAETEHEASGQSEPFARIESESAAAVPGKDDTDNGEAPGNEQTVSQTTVEGAEGSIAHSPRTPRDSGAVTFLYELHEHEIYNPKTDSWESRRFTQSPTTGEGGRDSTSLEPQSVRPPRNYLFDGEWKIDMTNPSLDGFGWEYYVGRYDGLGRRRRRWVRGLRRVSNQLRSDIPRKKKKKKTAANAPASSKAKQIDLFRYSFKGFGWSLYKSCVFAKSLGAGFRIPISANFDCYNQYLALPYISSLTYVGYPLVAATFLNCSVPMEAVKWFAGGILWKVQWMLAVASASIRATFEAVVWFTTLPWRTWKAFASILDGILKKSRTLQEEDLPEEPQSITNVTIETHIEMSNSSQPSVTASAVVESPRGGASATRPKKSFRERHLTMRGTPIPAFRRAAPIEYSSTVQERLGACMSWRVSQERGYEFRFNFFYTCLPTLIFWKELEETRKKKVATIMRRLGGVWGASPVDQQQRSLSKGDESSEPKNALSSFMNEHSSTLGLSAGWPLPIDPYFSFNVMLTMSSFYYGWILRGIYSLLSGTESKQTTTKDKVKRVEKRNEKLLSSVLKDKQVPLESSEPVANESKPDKKSPSDFEESDSDLEFDVDAP